jgi:hypothetical protein
MSGSDNEAGDDGIIGGGEPPSPADEEVGDDRPEGAQNLLDAVVGAFATAVDAIAEFAARIIFNPDNLAVTLAQETDYGTQIGQAIEGATPADEASAILVDTAEELILTPIQEEGELNPGNVERLQDDLEGNAAALLTGLVALTLSVEGASIGQIDEVPAELLSVVTTLGFDDVTGREIDVRLTEGVDPALKQLVHADHRSKQADFQDFLEANLRQKRLNPDVDPRDTPVSGATRDLFHPEDFGFLAEPEEYGTRPGQEPLYELVGMSVSEPEEIIEEPVQYGLPIPLRPVEQLGELQGFPEDVKDVYESVIDQLPQTENLIQEYIRLTEFNFRLREKVQAGVLTPETAVSIIEPEIRDLLENPIADDRYRPEDRTADEVTNIVANELRSNFELLQSLPSDPPTAGDIQSFYRKGVIDREQFLRLYEQFGRGNEREAQYLAEQTVDKGAEDIRTQAALDRLSDAEAEAQLELIGFSPGEATSILNGADPSAIVSDRLQDRTENERFPVDFAVEVGDARGAQLRLGGIESLQDLQNASVEELTTLTGMSDTEAADAINSAATLLREADRRGAEDG